MKSTSLCMGIAWLRTQLVLMQEKLGAMCNLNLERIYLI